MIGHPSCFMESVWCCHREWLCCAVTQNTLSLHITWQGLAARLRLCWDAVYVRRKNGIGLTHTLTQVDFSQCACMCVRACACVRARGRREESVCPHWQTVCNEPSLWADMPLLGASTLTSRYNMSLLCVCPCACDSEKHRKRRSLIVSLQQTLEYNIIVLFNSFMIQ